MGYQRFDGAIVLAASLGLLSVIPFIVLDGRFILEPDLLANQILYFYDVIRDGLWTTLPPQPPGNVYFEGNIIIYAFALHLFAPLNSFFSPALPLYEVAKVTVSLVNGFAHIIATVIFFATVRRLSNHDGIALLISLLFALSPQIINIDLVRSDRLMILGLIATLHASVAITATDSKPLDGVFLGLGMALLSSIKFTGAAFGLFPAIAIAVVIGRYGWKREVLQPIGATLVVGIVTALPVFALLMIRHVLHPELFIEFLKLGYAGQVGAFDAFYATGSIFYYNVGLFLDYGYVFLALVFFALIATIFQAVIQRKPTAIWLILCLLFFTIAGALVYKYERGGYHFVPLYLFLLSVVVHSLRSAERIPTILKAVGFGGLVISVATVVYAFTNAANIAGQRPDSIAKTRFDSRAWISENFEPGDRICMIYGSEWSNPHLNGLGLFVTTRMFNLPLERAAEAKNYVAPSLQQVRAACDAVVFDDLHKDVTVDYYRSHDLSQRLREWESLFAVLQQEYPAQSFIAETPAYFVSRVDVHDLRKGRAHENRLSPLDHLPRRAILDGYLEDDTLHVENFTVPLIEGRFWGFIDRSRSYNEKNLLLEGWAIDTFQEQPAVGIVVMAGDKVVGFDGTSTTRRDDVAKYYENKALQLAGFSTCLRHKMNADDKQSLRLFAIGADGIGGEISPETGIPVTEVYSGSELPATCRSSENLAFW